ncbi:MAG: alkaline phosphatase PhoX, partial [Pseudomonadota bacterium]
RPEDVVPNPKTGKVYVMLTKNRKRKSANAANKRANNRFGHIIEITEQDNEHSATSGYWDTVVECGDPDNPDHDAQWNQATSENGWFVCPDNGVIDSQGRLWISTDQDSKKTHLSGTADGLWGLETEGPRRGTGKMFYRVPKGAELCGPCFSEDEETLFLAVQHPGDYEKSEEEIAMGGKINWPDFEAGQPPRPSIVTVRKRGGGTIG